MEYEEIKSRLQKIIDSPMHPIPESTFEEIKKKHYEEHPKSVELFEEAQQVIPGGVEHNLSLEKPFPLTIDRAEGYNLWDADGLTYVDYMMGGGPIILGHHFRELDDTINELIREKGPSHGSSSEYEILAAKKIIEHMPGAEKVRFFQSGTESAMAAIRIARVFTGKKKIIKIGGNYHGWGDQLVYSLHIPDTKGFESHGIPEECFANTLDVRPNDFDQLEKTFEENKNEIAAVIVEPIGGESGTHPVHPDWNRRIRELCDAFVSLLIFDEVVTGFRLAMGGAQAYFNIKADLIVLGKIIAHGYPSSGAVAGRSDVMEACAAGVGAGSQRAYVGGTLTANHVTCAACYHSIRLMEKYDAVKKAAEYADRLTAALNELFETRKDLPFFSYNFGPIIHYETSSFFSVPITHPDVINHVMKRKKIAEEYQMVAIYKGLFALAGTRMYTCMAHDDESLKKTIDVWDYILSIIPKK